MRAKIAVGLCVSAIAFTSSGFAASATWRVSGVPQSDTLNMRERPGKNAYRVAEIPPNATGIEILECTNVDDVRQLETMSESEVKGALSNTWCRVQYRGQAGWVSANYLAREGNDSSSHSGGPEFWLAVFSTKTLDTAISKAVPLSKRFPSTMIFATKSGFYSVVLGHGPKSEAEAYRQSLIQEGSIAGDSYLTSGVNFTEAVWSADAKAETPSNPEVKSAPTPSPEAHISTGTGFQITREGHVVTNFHVAGDCQQITLNKPSNLPVPASLVAADRDNDLVVLKASGLPKDSVAPLREGASPKAGTEIVVFGFPLTGLLASNGNVVTGNITSLAGLGNKASQYQISAPVQPGNSGGPVLDREGRVVAVVVSKLDAMKAVEATGDIPQNINFAIKESVLQNFLESSSVAFQSQSSGTTMDTPALAEKAQSFTYMVECRK